MSENRCNCGSPDKVFHKADCSVWDALRAKVSLTSENATTRERLAYDRGYHHKAIDGSHIGDADGMDSGGDGSGDE